MNFLLLNFAWNVVHAIVTYYGGNHVEDSEQVFYLCMLVIETSDVNYKVMLITNLWTKYVSLQYIFQHHLKS
jgi:hypothetical protein